MRFSTISAYALMILFLGIIVIGLIYFFWKTRTRQVLDTRPSMPVGNFGEEKRKDPRIHINWPVKIETPEGNVSAEAKNISLGGAFISCKKPLPIGKVFNLTLIVPEDEPIAATAQVVWSNENVPEEKVINRGMGVRFIKMTERHLKLVRSLYDAGEKKQG